MTPIWLTVFVCALGGASPAFAGAGLCKGLTPATAPFPSFAECQAAGGRYQEAWLARHKDWQQGGVVCTRGLDPRVARPKP